MRRTLCLMLLATSVGCSGNAEEEARKAKVAEEETRQKKAAEQERKWQAVRAQVETLSQIAKKFYIDQNRYPQILDELVVTPQPGGNAAYCKAEALLDPWGQKFLYDPSGIKMQQAGDEGPDIYSLGDPSAPREIGNWMPLNRRP
jgi:type II secretion system (T2SS) protein G